MKVRRYTVKFRLIEQCIASVTFIAHHSIVTVLL